MATAYISPTAPKAYTKYQALYADLIFVDFENLLTGDKASIKNLVDLNLTLFAKIEALEIESRSIDQQIRPILDRLASTESELGFMKRENQSMKMKLASAVDATRSLYLRIEGMPENSNQNLLLTTANTLSLTGVQSSVNDIDHVYRVGKYKANGARPTIVKLMKEGLRNLILYNRATVNANKTSGFIWINDDVSDETRRLRKTVRDVAALAKIKGHDNIKIHGDGLIVDDTKYRHADLDLLPPSIAVDKAKSRESEDDIYFQGEYSPFSNFYPSKLTDDESGLIFYSAEQAFQHSKARYHNKDRLANKILCTRDPYDIKVASKQIPTSADWIDAEEGIMKKIIANKFHQNRDPATTLLATGNKRLHEASSDTKWATGSELSSKATLTANWSGLDLLGQLLEDVRADLVTRQGSISNFDDPPLLSDPKEDLLANTELLPLPIEDENNQETIITPSQQVQKSPRAVAASQALQSIPTPPTPTAGGSPSTPESSLPSPTKNSGTADQRKTPRPTQATASRSRSSAARPTKPAPPPPLPAKISTSTAATTTTTSPAPPPRARPVRSARAGLPGSVSNV